MENEWFSVSFDAHSLGVPIEIKPLSLCYFARLPFFSAIGLGYRVRWRMDKMGPVPRKTAEGLNLPQDFHSLNPAYVSAAEGLSDQDYYIMYQKVGSILLMLAVVRFAIYFALWVWVVYC